MFWFDVANVAASYQSTSSFEPRSDFLGLAEGVDKCWVGLFPARFHSSGTIYFIDCQHGQMQKACRCGGQIPDFV